MRSEGLGAQVCIETQAGIKFSTFASSHTIFFVKEYSGANVVTIFIFLSEVCTAGVLLQDISSGAVSRIIKIIIIFFIYP
ncbi:MAG: hypothetical protein ACOZBL_05515 [Patescibacteria group bacterium]